MSNKRPPRTTPNHEQRLRLQLAQEAARLMVEEGVQDFSVAKQKVAARLHLPRGQSLPRNEEIQQAIMEYQRLFKQDSHPQTVARLRQIALKTMSFFKDFEPRLVGAVADGSAGEFSPITLHLFTESSETLHLFMINQRLPYDLGNQRISQNNKPAVDLPVYHMAMEGGDIELIVFDKMAIRQPPRDPVTRKTMQRLDIKQLEALIQLTETDPALPI